MTKVPQTIPIEWGWRTRTSYFPKNKWYGAQTRGLADGVHRQSLVALLTETQRALGSRRQPLLSLSSSSLSAMVWGEARRAEGRWHSDSPLLHHPSANLDTETSSPCSSPHLTGLTCSQHLNTHSSGPSKLVQSEKPNWSSVDWKLTHPLVRLYQALQRKCKYINLKYHFQGLHKELFTKWPSVISLKQIKMALKTKRKGVNTIKASLMLAKKAVNVSNHYNSASYL